MKTSSPAQRFNQRYYSENERDQIVVDLNEPYATLPPELDNTFLDLQAVESKASSNDMS